MIHLRQIPLQLGTCEIKQIMRFQNTVVGEAQDRHLHSRREKKGKKEGVTGGFQGLSNTKTQQGKLL